VKVPASPPRARRASYVRSFGLCLVGVCLFIAAPASAEIGATASIFSEATFRGYSLSAGDPVAQLDFAYDDPSGAYATVSAIGVLRYGAPKPLGLVLNGGYARTIAPETSLDLGIVHSAYSHYSSSGERDSYTEIYAGMTHKWLSSRVSFSPHYFVPGSRTLYGEVNGNVSPARKWTIDGHVGILVPLRTVGLRSRLSYDWRIGVSRELGPFSLHLAWTDGAPRHNFYSRGEHSRSALIFGASWIL
jgi:uncharacterized protein (TIGR02001 family)